MNNLSNDDKMEIQANFVDYIQAIEDDLKTNTTMEVKRGKILDNGTMLINTFSTFNGFDIRVNIKENSCSYDEILHTLKTITDGINRIKNSPEKDDLYNANLIISFQLDLTEKKTQ